MSWVEDRLQILELVARYAHAFDDGEVEDYINCYTDDGAFHMRLGTPGEVRVEGREALRTMATRAASRTGQGAQGRHICSNTVVFEQTETAARARTYLLVMRSQGAETPAPVMTGVYHDQLVKTDDGWRFKLRHVFNDVDRTRAPGQGR